MALNTGSSNSSNSSKSTGILDKAIESVWFEGPEKSKSIGDTFGKDIDQILGEFKQKSITNLDTLFKQGVNGLGGLLGGFVSKFNLKSLGIDPNKVKDYIDQGKRIASAASQGLEVYKQFKEGNYSLVLDSLGGVLGNNLVNMGKYGLEMRDLVKNADFHSFAGLMDFVSNVTGVNMADALGISEMQAKIGALVQLAQEYGGADLIAKLQGKLFGEGMYPGLEQALATNLALNASFSQVDTIDEILKIIDGHMAGEINPDLINRILLNYRLPSNWKDNSLAQEKERLFRIFEKVDPNWDKEVINGKTYYKTKPWMAMSEDAKTLFGNDALYGVTIAIAGSYPELTVKEGLNLTYPYLNLSV